MYTFNDAGKVLVRQQLSFTLRVPQVSQNPVERSFSAGIMGGDECADVTGEIVRLLLTITEKNRARLSL